MSALYDTIGIDYANLRRPDPRIAAQIEVALGHARSVLNVGAGAGSYEPADGDVTALEPWAEMIPQRRDLPRTGIAFLQHRTAAAAPVNRATTLRLDCGVVDLMSAKGTTNSTEHQRLRPACLKHPCCGDGQPARG